MAFVKVLTTEIDGVELPDAEERLLEACDVIVVAQNGLSATDLQSAVNELKGLITPPGTAIFANYKYAENASTTSITSENYYSKLQFDYDTVAGDHFIQWCYESEDTKKKGLSVKLTVGGSDVLDLNIEKDISAGFVPMSGFMQVALPDGITGFELLFKSNKSGKAVKMKNARICVWRIL